jgi:hypothetical protein
LGHQRAARFGLQDSKYLRKIYGMAANGHGDARSKTELYSEHNNSRVTAGGDDSSEGAGIEDPASIWDQWKQLR